MLIIDYQRDVLLSLASNASGLSELPYFKPGDIGVTQELSATNP
jgi:hypothetical protein